MAFPPTSGIGFLTNEALERRRRVRDIPFRFLSPSQSTFPSGEDLGIERRQETEDPRLSGADVPFRQAVLNRSFRIPVEFADDPIALFEGRSGMETMVTSLGAAFRMPFVAAEEGMDRVWGEGAANYTSEFWNRGISRMWGMFALASEGLDRAFYGTSKFVRWNVAAAGSPHGKDLFIEAEGLQEYPRLVQNAAWEEIGPNRQNGYNAAAVREHRRRIASQIAQVNASAEVGTPFRDFAHFFRNLERSAAAGYVEPTGVLAEPIESVGLEFADPRRIAQTFLRETPNTLAMAGAALMGEAPFFVLIGSSSAEDWLQQAEAWEAESGEQIDPVSKAMGASLVALSTPMLERFGLRAMGEAGAVAQGVIQKNMMLRLLSAPLGEGATESLQGYTNNALALTYQDAPASAYVGDEIMFQALYDFYGGAVVGGGTGAALYGLGKAYVAGSRFVSPRPDAELIEFRPNQEGVLEPVFRVNRGRLAERADVQIEELEDAGYETPAFRRELLREQIKHEGPEISGEGIEMTLRLFDLLARRQGLTTDEYIKQARLIVHNNARITGGNALYQNRENPLNPIWTSRLHDELAIPGRLPKEMTAQEAMQIVGTLQSKGSFKEEEVEWTGVREFLQSVPEGEKLTREDVLEFVKSNGVQVLEIHAEENPQLPSDIDQLARNHFLTRGDGGYVPPSDLPPDEFTQVPFIEPLMEHLQEVVNTQDLMQLDAMVGENRELRTAILRYWQTPSAVRHKARFGMYTVGKGQRYREILLTLPGREPDPSTLEPQRLVGRITPLPNGLFLYRSPGGTETSFETLEEAETYQLRLSRRDHAPDISARQRLNYTSSHWGQIENPLVHMRVDDRVLPDGRRVLFINEIQSDWHQAGRERGYQTKIDPKEFRVTGRIDTGLVTGWRVERNGQPFTTIPDSRAATEQEALSRAIAGARDMQGVPNAPFKSSQAWSSLAIKRLLRLAVDEGYDGVMLTNGEAAARASQATSEKQIEGNRRFYNTIVRGELDKASKERGQWMPIPGHAQPARVGYMWRRGDDDIIEAIRVEIDQEGNPGPPFVVAEFTTREDAERFVKRKNDEEPASRELDETDMGYVIPITDKLKQRVYAGQPLFQGQNGAFQMMQSGERLVSLFESGNVTTLAHELVHVAETMLPRSALVAIHKALGADPQNITINDRERLAQAVEGMIFQGKLKIKGAERELSYLKEAFREIYNSLDTITDARITKKVREAFEQNLFGDEFVKEYPAVTFDNAKTSSLGRVWARIFDSLSITRQFERAGMPKLGESLRLFHSTIETTIKHWLGVNRQMIALSRNNRSVEAEALLAYESGATTNAVGQAFAPQTKELMHLYYQAFTDAQRELRKRGGIRQGFTDRLHDDLNKRLDTLLAGVTLPPGIAQAAAEGRIHPNDLATYLPSKDAQVAEATIRLMQQIKKAPANYVHIPYMWFEKEIDKNPGNAARVLRILAERERQVFSLNQLVEDGIIGIGEIDVRELLGAYAHRIGNDLALLNVRETAVIEGAARRRTGGLSEGWIDTRQPVLKGYEVHPSLARWIRGMTDPYPNEFIRHVHTFFKTFKMFQFYTPTVMTAYNIIQLGMGSGSHPVQAVPSLLKGYMSWLRQDATYEALEKAGLSSTPFSLPFDVVQDQFKEARFPAVRQSIIGAVLGAGIGSLAGIGPRKGGYLGFLTVGSRPASVIRWGAQEYARMREEGDTATSGFVTMLAKLPFRALRNMIESSYETTWQLDDMMRTMLAHHFLDQGLSVQEAAKLASETFGDYANISPTAKKYLDFAFFTPSFQWSMAKLYKDCVVSGLRMASGSGNQVDRHKALMLVNTFGILLGIDFIATMLAGWERDEWGKRYFRRVQEMDETRTDFGVDRELVVSFSGPHDVVTRQFQRAMMAATQPGDTSPLAAWAESNYWLVHPVLRTAANVIGRNEDEHGNPLWQRGEDDFRGWSRISGYLLRQAMPLANPVIGAEFDAEGQRMFEQQYSSAWEIASGAILFRYARTPRDMAFAKEFVYIAAQMEDIDNTLKERMMRGMTIEESERYASDAYLLELYNNWAGELERLEEEMDRYYWDRLEASALQNDNAVPVMLNPETMGFEIFSPQELQQFPPGQIERLVRQREEALSEPEE